MLLKDGPIVLHVPWKVFLVLTWWGDEGTCFSQSLGIRFPSMGELVNCGCVSQGNIRRDLP